MAKIATNGPFAGGLVATTVLPAPVQASPNKYVVRQSVYHLAANFPMQYIDVQGSPTGLTVKHFWFVGVPRQGGTS